MNLILSSLPSLTISMLQRKSKKKNSEIASYVNKQFEVPSSIFIEEIESKFECFIIFFGLFLEIKFSRLLGFQLFLDFLGNALNNREDAL